MVEGMATPRWKGAIPTIGFCTTCKGRSKHLERTLARNLADNIDYIGAKFIVLDYGDGPELANLIRGFSREIEKGKLVYYRTEAPVFKIAHAKNMAHRCAMREGADVLVNMDADNYADFGFAWWIIDQLLIDIDLFLWCIAKSIIGRARQGLAGRIITSKNLFLKAGGYDEQFGDWGPDDEDLKSRITRLGYPGRRIEDRFLYVIHHHDGLRFKEYPHAKPTWEQERTRLLRIKEGNNTIANFGSFGCGTVFRNFSATPIELRPMPTRIFGIGMQKTATTSLCGALAILGFDAAHFITPRWARDIWEEMLALGRSPTLERHYAVCDNPIPLLYKELDKAYPGSKFILTVREENEWIRSVRDHWDEKKNPYRKDWENDAFSHRLHQEIYGRKTFDAEVFLEKYRRHNAEVLSHFANRPDDLLVQKLERKDDWKWAGLCSFLDCKIPNLPYPRKFVTPKE